MFQALSYAFEKLRQFLPEGDLLALAEQFRLPLLAQGQTMEQVPAQITAAPHAPITPPKEDA